MANFWTPTPWSVKGLKPRDKLYFLLKSPIRKIGGWGSFSRYVDMTAEQAWTEYGLGNGVVSRDQLVVQNQPLWHKEGEDLRRIWQPDNWLHRTC